jgi:hypothetical protein
LWIQMMEGYLHFRTKIMYGSGRIICFRRKTCTHFIYATFWLGNPHTNGLILKGISFLFLSYSLWNTWKQREICLRNMSSASRPNWNSMGI